MAGIVKQQRILIETPNTKLEAMVFTDPSRQNGAAAVILHPYALLGGSMHDHMCLELFRAAAACKAFSLVIRYNQRGVGRSEGSMNIRGREDMADVLDVVEFAADQLPGPDKQVAVIGYSWGSCVAAHALSHPAVFAYVGVSAPLGGLSWVLQTKKHFQEVCRATHIPRLLLLGDQDQFTQDTAMQQLVHENRGFLLRQDDSFQPDTDAAAAMAAGTAGSGSGSGSSGSGARGAAGTAGSPVLPGAERMDLLLRIFPGEDHFWMAHGSMAAEYAIRWLEYVVRWLQQRRAAAAAALASPPMSPEPAPQSPPPAETPALEVAAAGAEAAGGEPAGGMPAGAEAAGGEPASSGAFGGS